MTTERQHRTPSHPFGVAFTAPLVLASVLNPINSSLIATAMVGIGVDFHRGPADTAVLISVLYLCSAVAQPTMGKLGPLFGERRVMIGGIVLVLIAGVIGTAGWSFGALVASRALLGIGTSAAYPMAMSLIRRRADATQSGVPSRILGIFSITAQVIAMVGLPIGGVLTGVFGWRAVFFINVPAASIALVLVAIGVPKDDVSIPSDLRRTLAAVDPLGIALFASAVVAALEFLRSPSVQSLRLGAIALALTAALVVWERRFATPLIDVRMLAANRPLVRTYLRQALAALGMYTTMYGVSQWMEQSAGYSPTRVGVLLLPMSAVSIVVAAISSRRGAVRVPLLATGAAFGAAGLVMLLLTHDAPLWSLLAMSLLIGLANGLNSFANQAALFMQSPADQVGVASGLYRTFAYIGAITSASLIGAAFGDHATDAGFHVVGWATVGIGAAVALLTVTDRALPRHA
ncbi:MFS transporter [Gordonia neofelifaecis]|uniref:Major facilitator superfamily MFS_1 n=1 Tax=Gordonia neofelifaecis NRRL B-59395 TaxID=644548 RepID=F1YKA5_9ACTN|nr:MFS transporter [Gordonia neofelifaecis]EGD54791.1 major facilitator superfamily MFS_1 [Gordonia neofelifaecis NRRL B-59395]